jgi:hypothetical protein
VEDRVRAIGIRPCACECSGWLSITSTARAKIDSRQKEGSARWAWANLKERLRLEEELRLMLLIGLI